MKKDLTFTELLQIKRTDATSKDIWEVANGDAWDVAWETKQALESEDIEYDNGDFEVLCQMALDADYSIWEDITIEKHPTISDICYAVVDLLMESIENGESVMDFADNISSYDIIEKAREDYEVYGIDYEY